ncbi:MAG TPA: ribonuclease domain-containing protein [Elusimicrobiales bacterium]|nr:ribonuclease domain-containing protein [Elusimicrobiales bacterium]
MIKNAKRLLNSAAFLSFFCSSALALGAPPAANFITGSAACPGALTALLASAAPAGNYVLSAENIRISPPAPVPALEHNRAAGPKPGKSFSPVIQDQVRTKLIMKLITDIYNGTPLPYAQDGAAFKNKEGLLPAQPLGYYREYTLITGNAPHSVVIGATTYPVSPDQGARGSERIMIGGGEKIFYTPDHYRTFIPLTVVY